MTQINRFDAFAHISSMKLEPDGDYVLYSDHVAAIAAVRQQAAQGRKVELPKVREILNRLWSASGPEISDDQITAALAELDAVEGRK